jgi:hypothetical protein
MYESGEDEERSPPQSSPGASLALILVSFTYGGLSTGGLAYRDGDRPRIQPEGNESWSQ